MVLRLFVHTDETQSLFLAFDLYIIYIFKISVVYKVAEPHEMLLNNLQIFICEMPFQDSLASLARRMRVDMSCFSKTCQHLPHRIRAHPRGAFILHRGIVPTMKRVSVEDFCPRIPRLKSRVLRDEE